MQEVIAGLEQLTFTFEKDVELQKGTGLLPFQGMDKSSSAVCNFFAKGLCEKGKLCPFRHNQGEKMVVCKHWLRGLCKKGDQCSFLHQYDVTRMPECYFYSKFGDCNNKECSFLHVKPAFKTRDCPWYDQGFCKDGPLCKHRHVHKTMCVNYLVGFCPKGPHCHFAHPKMKLLFNSSSLKRRLQEHQVSYRSGLRALEQGPCYTCRNMGHHASQCNKTPTDHEGAARALGPAREDFQPSRRVLSLQVFSKVQRSPAIAVTLCRMAGKADGACLYGFSASYGPAGPVAYPRGAPAGPWKSRSIVL